MADSALLHGAVRPWHVVFLIVCSWAVAIVAGTKVAQHVDVALQREFRAAATDVILASIILAFTVVVPEFRKTLPTLFAAPASKARFGELSLVFGVMACWAYGVYLIAFAYPLVTARPDSYTLLYFVPAVPDFEAKYLLYGIGMSVLAPVGEELLFRGYLLNVWIKRWGVWPAILASSVFFGSLHLERAVFAAGLGFILACVYLRYDSLWPGIVLHSAYNLLCVPWILGGIFYVKPRESISQWSHWIPEMTLAVLFVPLSLWFWRRFNPSRRT